MARAPGADEAAQRKIEHIPAEEIAVAVCRLLCEAQAASEEELPIAVRALFGFSRMGTRIRAAIEEAVAQLQRANRIDRGDDGLLRPADPAIVR